VAASTSIHDIGDESTHLDGRNLFYDHRRRTSSRATGNPSTSQNCSSADGSHTLDLFGDDSLPEGFRYQSDFLSEGEERSLLEHIKVLPFRESSFTALPAGAGSFPPAGAMISTAAALRRPRTCRSFCPASARGRKASLRSRQKVFGRFSSPNILPALRPPCSHGAGLCSS
jgi:hypothetical protein